ncbi:hypothetical protein BC938DRAFT_475222 [Jimgerdemannia flammicorona]|uniref:Uncharacterized protein n=1 Tax=Jimgerdemannia flammicorona TaxID=994334 RepID=A0A433PYV9_9FUNG|nr:hypothetical protein BC938DRAFT_475222 [Jimgerdemannia flammicorona]
MYCPPNNCSPEYVLMLRSINAFETAFLARSLTRMYDPINAAFPSSGPLSRSPPTRNDSVNLVRTISSELDTAKFDAGLLRSVAKNAVKALNLYRVKCDGLIATDPSAYQIIGPGPMSNSQTMNFELINNLYATYQSIWKVLEEFPEFVVEIMRDGVEGTRKLMLLIAEPLTDHIITELEAVVLKIHREDFSRTHVHLLLRQLDPHPVVKLRAITLIRSKTGPAATKQIAQRLLFVFIFQASLVRPLSEAGKLKLTGDMTQLEFSLSQLVGEHGMKLQDLGEDYQAFRAFKSVAKSIKGHPPLLFLDVTQLAAAHHTSQLPTLVLLHHLIVRSTSPLTTLPLPHKVYSSTEADYMKWVDEHTGVQAVEFILTAITKGSKVSEEDREKVPEYRLMKELVKERYPEILKV